jgi:hypothetical protein
VNVSLHNRTTVSLCFRSLLSTIITLYFPTWYQSLTTGHLISFWLLYFGCSCCFGSDWIFFIEDVVIVRGDRCSFLFWAAMCSVDSLCLYRFKAYSTFFLLQLLCWWATESVDS